MKKKKIGESPLHPPINPILTAKQGNLVKSTLQTRVPENFRQSRWGAERRVPCARTRERGPPSALAEFYYLKFLFLEIKNESHNQFEFEQTYNVLRGFFQNQLSYFTSFSQQSEYWQAVSLSCLPMMNELCILKIERNSEYNTEIEIIFSEKLKILRFCKNLFPLTPRVLWVCVHQILRSAPH